MNTSNWIETLARLHQQREHGVVVTILEDKGSTPRNAGTKMIVTADALYHTIGGGHLEYKATHIAREMLEKHITAPQIEDFSLGASLGQCCGGATRLLFEPFGQADVHIALFGAGHVGREIAQLLSGLPCRVRWIDSREQEFPEQIPEGVEKVVSEFPVDEVDEMPANSYYLVLTHNHQLDFELSEKILKRGDFHYFGLIGSKTKRMKFEHRLEARGYTHEQMERMRCPMGIIDVAGKLPAEIAISVAGEIIAEYNRDMQTSARKMAAAKESV